ncbi:hypothetical protein BaRGS_00003297, partial [Batillaria attramentaria]
DAHKELFLDILTKEEKEALLTKKMEDIRKRNEALQKRHAEIEADKKRAEKTGSSLPILRDAQAPKPRPPAALSNLDRASNSGHPYPATNHSDHPQPDRRGMREPRGRGRVYTQTFTSRKQGRIPSEDGPPPDPVNFLCDRGRDTMGGGGGRQQEKLTQDGGSGGGGGRGKDLRRHPRNFGGQDFNNVKSQMKAVKEKERDRRSFPPKNRMEMSLMLTGSERFQYEEWKAERQKVDQERMDRQKTASGEWRRAWDQEKNSRDFDEPPSPSRTEPARRPGTSAIQGMQGVVPETDRKPPAGRGRGRGRGRARAQAGGPGGGGEKPPRPRTWSGGDDSRTVECTNDNGLLLVKIDKSRSSDDHSVEVEYGNDDDNTTPGERRKSSPSKKKANRRSPVKQSKQNHSPHQLQQFQDADVPVPTQASMPVSISSQDSSMDGRPASLSQSLSHCSTDEWEDITGTDSDMYGTTEDEAESTRRGAALRLNPEAPVFLPTSPDLLKTPGSFHSSDSGASGPTSPSLAAAQPSLTPPRKESYSRQPVTNGSVHHEDAEETEESVDSQPDEPQAEVSPEAKYSEKAEPVTADHHGDADEGDDEDHFFDSEEVEEKATKVKEEDFEEEGLDDDPAHGTGDENADIGNEDVSAQGGASLADELSAAAGSSPRPASPVTEGGKSDEADAETVAASAQNEASVEQSTTDSDLADSTQGEAAQAEPSLTDLAVANCAQDEVCETEPPVMTDSELVGETLPDPATVDVPEEGASSCTDAPEEDAPQQAAQQMAATLTSSPAQAEESGETVMDKTEAAPEGTTVSSPEGCVATESSSSAPLVSIVNMSALSVVCRVLPEN